MSLFSKIWPIYHFENNTRYPENNKPISKKIKALRGWPFRLSQYFFVIQGSFVDARKILRRKLGLKWKSLNFFRKLLFFSGNLSNFSYVRIMPSKCFLTKSKHSEVIDQYEEGLELAMEFLFETLMWPREQNSTIFSFFRTFVQH